MIKPKLFIKKVVIQNPNYFPEEFVEWEGEDRFIIRFYGQWFIFKWKIGEFCVQPYWDDWKDDPDEEPKEEFSTSESGNNHGLGSNATIKAHSRLTELSASLARFNRIPTPSWAKNRTRRWHSRIKDIRNGDELQVEHTDYIMPLLSPQSDRVSYLTQSYRGVIAHLIYHLSQESYPHWPKAGCNSLADHIASWLADNPNKKEVVFDIDHHAQATVILVKPKQSWEQRHATKSIWLGVLSIIFSIIIAYLSYLS